MLIKLIAVQRLFTCDKSSESVTALALHSTLSIVCFACVLFYFISPVDGDCEKSLLKRILNADCVQCIITLKQSVVYWQAARVRLTEDCDGLLYDCPANH